MANPAGYPRFRDTYRVSCCNNPDMARTIAIFHAMCPNEHTIVSVEQNFGNQDKPCRWLVRYTDIDPIHTNFENAKAAFKHILRAIPYNSKCIDKHFSGLSHDRASTYNVLYEVIDCVCPSLDFEL